MYYCVGSLSVKNITEGWNISNSNPRSLSYSLKCKVTEKPSTNTNTIGRAFFSSGTKDYYSGILFNPKMTGDSWGPVPFVIMAPEFYSPEHPEGVSYEYLSSDKIAFDAGYLTFPKESSTINGVEANGYCAVGMIGKDGKYISPD